jgi:pimeloyl-ACP methyl ester carboxylesterase
MAHFLLVHGASHGAWCWSKLIPHIEAAGHTARAIDLPSHGDDPTAPETVTMADYVAACVGALEPETILVGHSLGGLTITLAAARSPTKVRSLVYLCAFVPPSGQAFAEIRKGAITPDLQKIVTVDRERGVSTVDPSQAGSVFYSDCSAEDIAFAVARLSPQPIGLLSEVLEFTPPSVARHYIRCTRDRTVDPAYQHAICADWPEGTVHEIPSGHSPFFSHPARLAEILGKIAAT